MTRIIVASRYMQGLLLQHGIPENKILVNPHPFVAADHSKAPAMERPNSILYVGRISPQKGAGHLVRAVATLEEPCILTLIGDGPSRRDVERLARELLGNRHDVVFTGWLPHEDVRRAYAEHQVVAFPSVWPEPFGRVGLEAAGLGKPVVAFDVGGVREWLVDGHNGLLVPPKDVPGFAAALTRLLRDETLRRTMGQNGIDLARTRFHPKRHVDAMLSLYHELLGDTATR